MSPSLRVILPTACMLLLAVPARAEVPVVELTGVVHAVSASHVVSALERAEAQGAPLVVVRMDTPGGLDVSMRRVVDKMLACKVPVAVFVGPSGARAASAGFIIAVAADIVAMAPGTNMGAAHPVSAGGVMDEVMSKKVTSDAAAYIRSKASRRGRNVEMAEKAVVESRSFTEKEALEAHLIDLVAADVPELLRLLEAREVTRFDGSKTTLRLQGHGLVTVQMDKRQRVLSALASPELMFLLLLGALAGIGGELSHPGALFPGIVGVVCLTLFLFAAQVIPVNWAGVVLIVLTLGLFAAEVKVTSYGLLTVAGIASMILGAMMLVDAPGAGLAVPLRLLLPAALAMAGGTFLLVRLVLRAQRSQPVTGGEGLVGRRALALTDLHPQGWISIQGERWRGVSDGDVHSGEPVTVVSVDGLTVRVRKGA